MRRLLYLFPLSLLSCSDSDAAPAALPALDAAQDSAGSDTGNDVDANDAASDAEPTPDASADAPAPYVVFLEPAEGAVLPNPVVFRIQASGVDQVEIFADETYSLAAAWDPSQRDTLTYRFSGTGEPRSLHVAGRMQGVEVARDDLTITILPDSCEDRFFVSEFDDRNEDPTGSADLLAIREEALAALKQEVQALQSCGAGVTLARLSHRVTG